MEERLTLFWCVISAHNCDVRVYSPLFSLQKQISERVRQFL